jgi:ankyrin repeat protein
MAANDVQPGTFYWKNPRATDNARQHNGNAYNNNITNNYTSPTPPTSVPVKPREDPIHGDLIRACSQGQGSQRLNFLIARGADIDYRDEQKRTPLHHAASSGSIITVRFLVTIGADIHAFASRVGTPLHAAALGGSKEVVECLIQAGCKVGICDEWIGTPLHAAALSGSRELVQYFIRAGNEVGAPAKCLAAPLHFAAFSGSADTVRCLLENNAEKNDLRGWVGTPLSIAAAKGHMDVLEVLLDYGADVNKSCGYFGSAAHMACAAGNVELLWRLHLARACFKMRASTCHAIYYDIFESVPSSFLGLLGSHDLNEETPLKGGPVILAIDHGHLEAVRFCKDLQLDVDEYSSFLVTSYPGNERKRAPPFTRASTNLAIARLDRDMLQLLLDRGVGLDLDRRMFDVYNLGRTPNGKNASACISLIIKHGLQKNSLDTKEDTFMMHIMRRDNSQASYEILKALLQHNADVNAANQKGQTALMIAAGFANGSQVRYVELLCKHGAVVNRKDKDGRTALEYAEKWGDPKEHEDVRWILQSFSRNGSR